VQIVHKRGRRVVGIEHIGSAHDEARLAVLMEIARQQLHAGQEAFDLNLDPVTAGAPGRSGRSAASRVARVAGMRSQLLWDVLEAGYERLGFGAVGDEAFKDLVLGRIVEPTSKADTLRPGFRS
jgi:hypothetical protein